MKCAAPAAKIILAGSVVCLLGACANITRTVTAKTRVFVKVPDVLPPKKGESRELPIKGDWKFRHVVDAQSYDDHRKPTRSQWYQVYHTDKRDQLGLLGTWISCIRNAHVRRLTPEVCDAVKKQFGRYPDMVIPEQVFSENSVIQVSEEKQKDLDMLRMAKLKDRGPAVVVVTEGANPLWPLPGKEKDELCQTPLWYKGNCYSQLDLAQKRVLQKYGRSGVPPIRIGILDTGFDNTHAAIPVKVEDEKGGDGIGFFLKENGVQLVKPGATNTGHGTGTIGILAGREVRFVNKKGDMLSTGTMGAVSNATIVPVRVAPFVVSLSTANLAYGIDYASREKQCDVISISNGGSPSPIWVDAVNAAYNRGTVIVGAAGNYVSLPGIPLRSWAAPVYPAAFRRVIAATAETANGGSYSRNDWPLFVKSILQPWTWHKSFPLTSSFMKGSYGIDGSRDLLPAQVDPAFLGDLRKDSKPRNVSQRFFRSLLDWQQVKRVGELGASSISAYAPNTAWLVASSDASGKRKDAVRLDGGGTSSAAPQVAGAAALYMQYHYKDLPRNSKRVQAVHTALALTAHRSWEKGGARRPENENSNYYKGAGALKASDALDVNFQKASSIQGDNLRYETQPRDFYDASRSMRRILFPRFEMNLADKNRLDQVYTGDMPNADKECRQHALERVYYNQELVEHWRRDINPVRCVTIWNWLTLPRVTAVQTVVTERGIKSRAQAKANRARKIGPAKG